VTVELFDIHDAERLSEVLAIRLRVFVDEQGVPLELEIDEHDRDDFDAVHALAREEDGTAIGAGRFYELDLSSVKIGRMAVDADRRKCGAGARLLEALIAEAQGRGFTRACLDAQTTAVDFYRRAGFQDDGEPLWDAGILHQPMSKQL
jgi:hypothetical protein